MWNCCCCKRFYANYKIHRPGMLVLSLSLSCLSLFLSLKCLLFLRGLHKRQPNRHLCRRLMQLTFQCQAATHTIQTAWLSITFYNNKTQITFPTLSPPTYLLYVVSRCTSSLHRKCFWYRLRWFASRLVWVCRLMMIGWMLSKAKYKKRQSPVWVRQRERVRWGCKTSWATLKESIEKRMRYVTSLVTQPLERWSFWSAVGVFVAMSFWPVIKFEL